MWSGRFGEEKRLLLPSKLGCVMVGFRRGWTVRLSKKFLDSLTLQGGTDK